MLNNNRPTGSSDITSPNKTCSPRASGAVIDEIIHHRIEAANEQAKLATASESAEAKFFRDRVQPILQTHCVRCHGEKQQGELTVLDRDRLLLGGESGEPAIVPARPDDSQLLQLVAAGPDDYRMPPKGDGLSEQEVDTIRKWIEDGAAMPAIVREPIELSGPVDDMTFLRRVFLDTVGVPPTPSEAREFFQDRSPDRREVTD